MSRFLNDSAGYSSDYREAIDFDNAVKLRGGGSTCDLYRTRWQRREVFVKRLKEEFRAKPLYLDALDKEYEIGVNLKHPSLPEYREFHWDYIVMDFIDGETLDELIKRKDPWLADERHVLKLLRELLSVVDYLHLHNVVHCDIKPDNIMITSNNRNLVLIDFDKSYTDSLNDTSGNPSKYGLKVEEIGRASIDFHGIGRIVERLKREIPGFKFSKYKQFEEACNDPEVNCEILNEILANPDSPSGIRSSYLTGGIIILGLLVAIIWFGFERRDTEVLSKNNEITIPILTESDSIINPNKESISPASINSLTAEITSEKSGRAPSLDNRTNISSEEHPVYHEPSNIEDVYDLSLVKDKLNAVYNLLFAELNRLELLAKQSDMSKEERKDIWEKYGDYEDAKIEEIVAIIKETYPGIYDEDLLKVLNASAPLKHYRTRHTALKRIYQD